MKTPQKNVKFRPVPRENFNERIERRAIRQSMPMPPDISPEGKGKGIAKNMHEVILEQIEKIRKKDGIIIIALSILTDFDLLEALSTVNCFGVIDKCSPNIPLTTAYNRLSCAFNRADLPGNIMSHLRYGIGIDYGFTDAIRMFGNFYSTLRSRINEKRPLFHPKDIVGIVPLGNKKWDYLFAIGGSRNGSETGHLSIEKGFISFDKEYVKWNYDWATVYYANSCDLYNFSEGLGDDFLWESKPVKYNKLTQKCPDCGGTNYTSYWLVDPHKATKVPRCINCNELLI